MADVTYRSNWYRLPPRCVPAGIGFRFRPTMRAFLPDRAIDTTCRRSIWIVIVPSLLRVLIVSIWFVTFAMLLISDRMAAGFGPYARNLPQPGLTYECCTSFEQAAAVLRARTGWTGVAQCDK
jgi:hypothetical protein